MLMHVRRSLGMARVVVHLLRGAATMAVVLPFAGEGARRRIVQNWSAGVLQIFGLDLVVDGPPPAAAPDSQTSRAVLLVGNHISWIDIYAFLSVADIRFVAKSEVRSWPLIGWFAQNLGTIFVERDRPRDAIRVATEIRSALTDGQVVCVFPEGTTTDGSIVLPFSSVLLNAAVETGADVRPVSIAYRRPDGAPCTRTAFTGDTTLVGSIWALAAGERSTVHLTFLPAMPSEGAERRVLARTAEDAVRASLGHSPRPPLHGFAGRSGNPANTPDVPDTPEAPIHARNAAGLRS